MYWYVADNKYRSIFLVDPEVENSTDVSIVEKRQYVALLVFDFLIYKLVTKYLGWYCSKK